MPLGGHPPDQAAVGRSTAEAAIARAVRNVLAGRQPLNCVRVRPMVRHRVRKLDIPRRPAFEDRLWPIHAGVVGLTAYLTAVAAVRLPWDEPRWWANAAFFVALVPLMAAAAIAVIHVLQRKL